jgi:hypothetical protein
MLVVKQLMYGRTNFLWGSLVVWNFTDVSEVRSACYQRLAGCLFGLLFHADDETHMFL